jgi:hypothetical protein
MTQIGRVFFEVVQESSMEPDKLNRWLTLGANVGVLIGIILLIIELDQNRDMIRAQTRNDILQQLSNSLLIVASNSELNSVIRRARLGEELSEDEERQVYLYQVANLRDWENMHYQYRQGMFDDTEFEAERRSWQFVITSNNKSFAKTWCRTRQNYSPAFSAEIDSILGEEACLATN